MKRTIARLSLILCLCALCVSVSTVVGATPSAHAAAQAPQLQLLGNVKLDPYCQSLGYARGGLADSTYYGWRCLNAQGSSVWVINMAAACEWQYNDPSAIDMTLNFYSATSARCYHPNAFRGAPDVLGYCQQAGFGRVVTIGSTAYDWRCIDANGFTLDIGPNMVNACFWTYHVTDGRMIARFANFYSTTSWQCWS